jgi:hypothetical protein
MEATMGSTSDTQFRSFSATDTGVRIAVAMSAAALFVSGWSFLLTLDDDAQVRQIEQRLACLELPGPNDCGLDRR